jgi:hypothetical protein
VDDVIFVVKDLQPAALIVVALALVAILSNMIVPIVGPWASMLAVGAVTIYVGNRVLAVDQRPEWLLPLAFAGVLMAAAAGYRLWKAIHANMNSDKTIGYIFPTALAICALWLSIALIEFDASKITAVAGG